MFKKIIYSIPLLLLPLNATADQVEQKIVCAATSTTLLYGQHAVCQIDDELDQDQFNFSVSEGDLVYISLKKVGGGYRPAMELFSPSNVKLQSAITYSSEGATAGLTLKALERGVYSLNIRDSTGGLYRLQLDSTKTALDDTPLAYGLSFQNNIDYANDRDYFAIDMVADTTVSFVLSKASALYRPIVRIFNPSNIELVSAQTYSNAGASTSIELPVYQSGKYVVEIMDTSEGVYELSTQCVSGNCPVGGPPQPSLDYLAGLNFCKSNPVECGVAMPRVNADLSISMPLASYGDPVQELWAELRYTGDMTWELDDFDFIVK